CSKLFGGIALKTPYVLQVVGYKNSGKTKLVSSLVTYFSEQGLRVGTLKHHAHSASIDSPGTDTAEHAKAGAAKVLLSSEQQTATFEQKPLSYPELLKRAEDVDIVLVEGFKREQDPKVVLLRGEKDAESLLELSNLLCVISDSVQVQTS